jgi:ribosome-binding protein aMBF1 (putative translation factor)
MPTGHGPSRSGDAEGTGASAGVPSRARRHPTPFPGFREMAQRRVLARELVQCRVDLGLSQTEVAARMGTSQSAVARLESGEADVRLSTLERYASALDRRISWRLEES